MIGDDTTLDLTTLDVIDPSTNIDAGINAWIFPQDLIDSRAALYSQLPQGYFDDQGNFVEGSALFGGLDTTSIALIAVGFLAIFLVWRS
jgi:hypothetical protein